RLLAAEHRRWKHHLHDPEGRRLPPGPQPRHLHRGRPGDLAQDRGRRAHQAAQEEARRRRRLARPERERRRERRAHGRGDRGARGRRHRDPHPGRRQEPLLMVERRSSRARTGGSARPVEGSRTPPSFTPRGGAARPAQDGALPVGSTPAEPATRVMPVTNASRPAPPRTGGQPPRGARPEAPSSARPPRGRRRRRWPWIVAVALVLLLAWPVGLLVWADGRLDRVEALSGAAGTPGTTYLLAGSDERDGSVDDDGTLGGR